MQETRHSEVLESLARFETGATFAEIQKLYPTGLLGELARTLDNLRRAQFVAELLRNGHLCYEVTAAGRKILSPEKLDGAPASALPRDGSDRPELREPLVPAQVAAAPPSDAEFRRVVARSQAVATVCLDGFSLDNWWEEQDVEVKANAFLLWTLGASGSATEEDDEVDAVPLAGTVGADPVAIRRLHEAIHGKHKLHDALGEADGCGGDVRA